MSNSLLRFVPVHPDFAPTQDDVAAAQALLREMAGGGRIEAASRFLDGIEFIDCGGNFSGVDCSACGAGADDWWSDAVSEAFETRFANLDLRARCCGALVDLNGLRYRWPVAFGRYVLECEPFAPELPTQAQVDRLGAALGCPLRLVPAHY